MCLNRDREHRLSKNQQVEVLVVVVVLLMVGMGNLGQVQVARAQEMDIPVARWLL